MGGNANLLLAALVKAERGVKSMQSECHSCSADLQFFSATPRCDRHNQGETGLPSVSPKIPKI
jgi:hypothetical protein